MDNVKSNTVLRFAVLTLMVAAVAALRWLAYLVPSDWAIAPYLHNFAPITALALFGGAKFTRWYEALVVPLVAAIASDATLHVLGFARLENVAEIIQQLSTYVFFVAVVGIGRLLRGRENVLRMVLATIGSTIGFWIVSNFTYWLLVSETVAEPQFNYPKTLEGLMACYVAALPFLRNPMIGDLCYVGVLFGGYALATRLLPGLREKPVVAMA